MVMTVSELLEQAKALTPQERRELARQLLAMQSDANATEAFDWSDDELAELLTSEPLTGAEIVAAGLTGSWADLEIADGATWVQEQRRKHRERNQW
ncbi:MAG: hypothetical protein ACOCZH_00380 [Phototrophicaceae bacterium]